PLGDGVVNVGAGLLNTFKRFKEVSARKVMDVFLRQLPPEWGINEGSAVGPLLSGPIPMGINRRPLAAPGLLLVGDAAGVTNPFNGEGIAYAMETGYLAVLVFGGLIGAFAVLSMAASALLRPHRRMKAKFDPYECGIEPVRLPAWENFPVKFYVVAMLFIIFDIEVIFLFPWAVAFR